MLRFMVIALCLAVPAVWANSAGAPQAVCKNGLTPEHHVEPQSSAVPYSFSGSNGVKAGDKITLTLGGGDFLGFALQAHDKSGKPVGTFKVIETNKSQLLTCSKAGVSCFKKSHTISIFFLFSLIIFLCFLLRIP